MENHDVDWLVEIMNQTQGIAAWNRNPKFHICPEPGTIRYSFPGGPSADDPASLQAHRILQQPRSRQAVGGVPLLIDPMIHDKWAFPVLVLLVSEERAISGAPIAGIELRRQDPQKKRSLGTYIPTRLACSLTYSPNGEMLRTKRRRFQDYPVALIHELGHAFTYWGRQAQQRLIERMAELTKTNPMVRAMLQRVFRGRYDFTRDRAHEVSADLWIVKTKCPRAWKALTIEHPEIRTLLAEVELENFQTVSEKLQR